MTARRRPRDPRLTAALTGQLLSEMGDAVERWDIENGDPLRSPNPQTVVNLVRRKAREIEARKAGEVDAEVRERVSAQARKAAAARKAPRKRTDPLYLAAIEFYEHSDNRDLLRLDNCPFLASLDRFEACQGDLVAVTSVQVTKRRRHVPEIGVTLPNSQAKTYSAPSARKHFRNAWKKTRGTIAR